MARCPFAIWRPMPYATSLMPNPVRANLHTAVTNASSLFHYFATQSGGVHSHFYVAKDGTIEQYRDTAYAAAADYKGNPDTISIETWDGYPVTFKTAATVIAWEPAQIVALVKLLAWILDEHPTIPRRLATTSKADSTSHGIGWHRLGVPATYAQLALNRSQTGGLLWSKSVGKTCPGDKRIAQIPGILAALNGAPVGGIGGGTAPIPKPPTAPAPVKEWPAVDLLVDGVRGPVTVRAWQRLLASINRYSGLIDGQWGPMSVRAEQSWLRSLGYYFGLTHGDEGPMTITALQRFLAAKGHYKGLIDGSRGPLTVKAEQSYLNDQRKFQ